MFSRVHFGSTVLGMLLLLLLAPAASFSRPATTRTNLLTGHPGLPEHCSYAGAGCAPMIAAAYHEKLRKSLTSKGSTSTSLQALGSSTIFPMAWKITSASLTITGDILAALWKENIRPLTSSQKVLMAATFFLGVLCGRIRPFWKRFRTTLDIPGYYFGASAPNLIGRAASVSDGDTFRFLHTPTVFSKKTLSKKQKLSEHTLPIRICTIDTPETAKFGKSGQAFGDEAKDNLKKILGTNKVRAKLLQKDQYGRAVAEVYVRGGLLSLFRKKYVDELMLQAGLAEVYRGAGAVYGRLGLDAYSELEEAARNAKKGIWSQGDKRESAAEYKRRTK